MHALTRAGPIFAISESVDSLCRDGADTPPSSPNVMKPLKTPERCSYKPFRYITWPTGVFIHDKILKIGKINPNPSSFLLFFSKQAYLTNGTSIYLHFCIKQLHIVPFPNGRTFPTRVELGIHVFP